jgi:hypothetical protein
LPQGHGGYGGRVGAQDARTQRHRRDEGKSPQALAFLGGEAAFRADQDGGWIAASSQRFDRGFGVAALITKD